MKPYATPQGDNAAEGVRLDVERIWLPVSLDGARKYIARKGKPRRFNEFLVSGFSATNCYEMAVREVCIHAQKKAAHRPYYRICWRVPPEMLYDPRRGWRCYARFVFVPETAILETAA